MKNYKQVGPMHWLSQGDMLPMDALVQNEANFGRMHKVHHLRRCNISDYECILCGLLVNAKDKIWPNTVSK